MPEYCQCSSQGRGHKNLASRGQGQASRTTSVGKPAFRYNMTLFARSTPDSTHTHLSVLVPGERVYLYDCLRPHNEASLSISRDIRSVKKTARGVCTDCVVRLFKQTTLTSVYGFSQLALLLLIACMMYNVFVHANR